MNDETMRDRLQDLSDRKLRTWEDMAREWPSGSTQGINADAFLSLVVEVRELREEKNTRAQASAPEGGEPIAWESTTPAYFKYITQSKYDKISDAAKQWYKPYRCSDCTNAPEGGVVACNECGGAGVYPKVAMLPEPPDVACRKCHGSGRDYTRSNAKAGEVDGLAKLVAAKFLSGNSIEVERIVITRAEYDALQSDLSTHDKTKA